MDNNTRIYYITSDKENIIRIFKNKPTRITRDNPISYGKRDLWYDFSFETSDFPREGIIINEPHKTEKYKELKFEDEPLRIELSSNDCLINKTLLYNAQHLKNDTTYFVARDEDGSLYMYAALPIRDKDEWENTSEQQPFRLDKSLFPEIEWSDEPYEICLSIKNQSRFGHCHHCDKMFKYRLSDIKTSYDCQPSSSFEDFGTDYITCPHCGGYIDL